MRVVDMAHRVHVAPADGDHHLVDELLLRRGCRIASASPLGLRSASMPSSAAMRCTSARSCGHLGGQARLLGLQRRDLAGATRSPSPAPRGTARADGAPRRTAGAPSAPRARPGARGSFTTRGRLLASASSSRKPSTDEMSAKRCSRSQFSAQFGRGLRAAQHQHRQQRHRLRRARPARAPCCARSARRGCRCLRTPGSGPSAPSTAVSTSASVASITGSRAVFWLQPATSAFSDSG